MAQLQAQYGAARGAQPPQQPGGLAGMYGGVVGPPAMPVARPAAMPAQGTMAGMYGQGPPQATQPGGGMPSWIAQASQQRGAGAPMTGAYGQGGMMGMR